MSRTADPSPEELQRWGRLVAAVKVAATSPRSPAPQLASACKLAKVSIVPSPPPTKTHPFVRLVRLVDRFLSETAAGREAMADELVEVARLCGERLDPLAAPPSPPLRRHRADIDG